MSWILLLIFINFNAKYELLTSHAMNSGLKLGLEKNKGDNNKVILNSLTIKNEIVFDPLMETGTTGIAALNLKEDLSE